jgi:hypothetical protein
MAIKDLHQNTGLLVTHFPQGQQGTLRTCDGNAAAQPIDAVTQFNAALASITGGKSDQLGAL